MNAAGILFLTPDNVALFLKRRDSDPDHPGEWDLPGGSADDDESLQDTARREANEETQDRAPAGELEKLCLTTLRGVDYTTFVQHVDTQFVPVLNSEHGTYKWAPVTEPPNNLHPGLAEALTHLRSPIATDAMLAFDRASVRTFDANGNLHVALTSISKANICGYLGREIPDSEKLGLQSDKIYQLLRDPQELKKAAATFNNVPLLSRHVPVSATAPQKNLVVGSTGTDAVFHAPYLMNSLVIWDAVAIAGVESEEQKELSCAYRYRADMTPGTFEGAKYDGVMRDIRGNHVALVVDGRAGDDVVVGDSSLVEIPMSKRNKTSHRATLAKGALTAFLMPRLAQDAKIDLDKIVNGVTAANWLAKKSAIVGVVQLAVKDKLAKDASIEGLVKLLDGLDNDQMPDDNLGDAGSMADDPLPVDPAADPMPADPAAGATPDPAMGAGDPAPTPDPAADPIAKVLEFLQGKLSDEDMAQLEALLDSSPGSNDADPQPQNTDDPGMTTDPTATPPGPPPTPGAPAVPVTSNEENPIMEKKAMDAAIAKAKDSAVTETMQRMRAVAVAEKAVRPFIGDVVIALDSAEEVYKMALDAREIDLTDVHPSAYKTMVAMLPREEATATPKVVMAADAASISSFKTRFPTAGNVRQLGAK